MEDEYRAALIRAGFADRAEAFQAARDDKNNAAADRRAEAARRADAVLDRIVHHSLRVELFGESIRKRKAKSENAYV